MADALTPMMQQYQRLRASVPADTLLLFRLGDFYELFFEDAKEASGLLNLALTHRNSVPMCGMPYHAAQGYISKLIQAGRRVAVCDQTSEPQPGKIVNREITQIITAGTVSELDLLKANRPNYLGAVYFHEGRFGFAYAELSTGEFRVTEAGNSSALLDDLARISPAEVLVSERQSAEFGEILGALAYDDFAFLTDHARFTLCEHFQVKSLDGFGCSEMPAAIGAAGAIIHYLKQQLRRKVDHLASLRCDARDDYVMLDAATQVNLELVESRGARNMSLLAALDRTVTPMGGRKLRSWILQPLRDLGELERRQQLIADLLHEADLLAALEAITGAPMSAPITQGAPGWYHPGRSGTIAMGPKVIAQFGELHPKVLAAFDLKAPAAGFEIFLDAIPDTKSKGKAKPLFAPSPYQAIERDFAFVVDAKIAAGDIVKAVKLADRNLIDTVSVFDVYEGKGVPEGQKSVAVAVRIQPKDATLTEAEIEALAQKIVAAALKLGATLRS